MQSQSSMLQQKTKNDRIYFYLKCSLKLTYSDVATIQSFQPTSKIEEQQHQSNNMNHIIINKTHRLMSHNWKVSMKHNCTNQIQGKWGLHFLSRPLMVQRTCGDTNIDKLIELNTLHCGVIMAHINHYYNMDYY